MTSVGEWVARSWLPESDRLSGRVLSVLSVIAGLVIWELFSRTTTTVLLAPPTAVAVEWMSLTVSGTLPTTLLESLKHAALGYVLAVVSAIPLGFAMGQSSVIRRAVSPYVDAVYSTPVVAYVPLIIVWFGLGFHARVFLVFIFCFFEVLIDTYEGISSIDPEYRDVADSFDISPWQKQTKVMLPASLPFVFAGLRLGIGRAVRGMIVAELFLQIVNLGELMTASSNQFNTSLQLAIIITISLVGVVTQYGMKYLERRTIPWEFEATRPTGRRPLAPVERWVARGFRWSLSRARAAVSRVASALSGVRAALATGLGLATAMSTRIRSLPPTEQTVVIHGGALVVFATGWEVTGRALGEVLFAPLSVVVPTYIDLAVNGPMIPTLVGSLQEMFLAFGLATLVGLPLGFVMGRSRIAEDVFDPWVSAMFVTSTSATLPLIIILFGTGLTFRLWIIWFGTVFYMVLNVYQGANKVSARFTDVARTFDASTFRTYRSVIFPATFPYLVASLRIGLARSIRGLILAETYIYVGYGGLIGQFGNQSISTAPVLALIVTIMILGYVFRRGLEEVQAVLMPWGQQVVGEAE